MVVLEPTAEEAESESGFTEVEKDGSFEIQGIHDGSYALAAYGFELGSIREIGTYRAMKTYSRRACRSKMERQKGTWKSSSPTKAAQLEGAVTDSDQEPAAGWSAVAGTSIQKLSTTAFARAKQVPPTRTATYVIKDVPPGKYKVTAKIPSSRRRCACD